MGINTPEKQKACRKKKDQPSLRRLAADAFFPMSFFLRNMMELERELWWKRLSPRVRRLRIGKMLRERVAVVMEVKRRGPHHYKEHRSTGWSSKIPITSAEPSLNRSEISSYCTHCGMCCETASGLPDFPPQTQIPEQWQRLFGDGLGRGHRFCPFLWESKNPHGSLCAIHPWRSYPCRIFERDDCEFVKRDPDFKDLADRRTELVIAWRCLSRLINTR